MTSSVVRDVQLALQSLVEPGFAASQKKFFKEEITVRGVRSGNIDKVRKQFWPHIKTLPTNDILIVCESLLKSGYIEDAFVAYGFAEQLTTGLSSKHTTGATPKLARADFTTLSRWLHTYVSNWAECDTLCNHPIGNMLMAYPEFLKVLRKDWTASRNRWVRRGAAVSLIVPARKGLFLDDIFAIADALMSDADDLVRKGYGWALKAASEAHEQDVFDFVMARKDRMPRVALRYAVEKMDKEKKKRLI